jgi:FtsP/CotA-like multicopper oxidase with cupredoxin domain
MSLSRRAMLAGLAVLAATAAEALGAPRKKATKKPARPTRRSAAKAAPAPKTPNLVKKPEGRKLPIPELVALKDGDSVRLAAGPVTHDFLEGKPAATAGYNGRHLGPALRIERGARARVTLANGLDRPTGLTWHGLLLDGAADAALALVAPGAEAVATLNPDQPAATLWYHADVTGQVGRDLQEGLAGLLIVDDEATRALGLPSDWGVDDIPLVIQDKSFDEAGAPRYDLTPAALDHGFRGSKAVVNGTVDAVHTVPQRLVRMRLVNASSARNYRIYFSDERSFRIIAMDAGLLPAPVEADTLSLAPGERVEILVDFADGGASLMSTPDAQELRRGSDIERIEDIVADPFRICAFISEKDDKPSAKIPAELVPNAFPVRAPDGVKRRRFVLSLGLPARLLADRPVMGDAVMPAGSAGGAGPDRRASLPGFEGMATRINGRTYDPARIDEAVPLGATEIWEIVTPDMAHPFHIEGAQFRMLSEDGGTPKIWNRGVKDTVMVENSAELLVQFTRPADRAAPHRYYSTLREHEDTGMIGTLTVG